MARFNNGIMGGFTGIIGQIEGYIRKGQPVMRARRKKVTKPSEAQKACRQRMKVVNEFTYMITDYVRIGFELDAAPTTKTANNLAKSYQLLHGLKGEYPNLEIDYPKVRVTSGTLEVVQNPTMVLEGSALNFSWENDKIRDNNFEDDQLMILVYYPDRKTGTRRYTGAKRGALKDTIKAYKLKPGERLEAYLSFRSDDRKSISNSVYVGSITGEAVIEASIEALEQELPLVESEITKVEPETVPAIEAILAIESIPVTKSISRSTFKSKLIVAIERTVEARSKPAIESTPKLTFKSKLIAAIERTVEARSKPALPIEQKLTTKTAPVVGSETAIQIESDLIAEKGPAVEVELKLKVGIAAEKIASSSSVKTGLVVEVLQKIQQEVFSGPVASKSIVSSSRSNKKKRPLLVDSRIKVMQQLFSLTG
jgi:hypothetical protein